jgi:hypothetical protein
MYGYTTQHENGHLERRESYGNQNKTVHRFSGPTSSEDGGENPSWAFSQMQK